MNFHDYRPLALRTAKILPSSRLNLRHAVLGLLTELGELATEVKRVAIYGKELTDAMRDHCIEEAGDAQWYVPLALMSINATDDEVKDAILNSGLSFMPRREDLADTCCTMAAMAGAIAMVAVGKDSQEDRDIVLQACAVIIILMNDKVAPALGVEPDAIRFANIAKLRLRFPESYTDAAAEARADKGGRSAIES